MTRLGTTLGEVMAQQKSPRELAARFGLVTGDAVEAAGPKRRTKIERQAEDDLGLVVVALIGHAQRVPLKFTNDNAGGRGVAIVLSADPRHVYMPGDEIERTGGLAARTNAEQAFDEHLYIELGRVYLANERHGALFKAALESALIGSTGRARKRFRNIPPDFDMDMLGLLFSQASDDAGVPCFDSGERDRRRRVREQQITRKAKGK